MTDHAANRRSPHRRPLAARRGFTLTELMVVTTLIGVMAAMSVPSFQRAVQQSRVDIAVANLRAIWAAERLYWLENHTYTSSDQHPARPLALLDNGIPSDGGQLRSADISTRISPPDSDTPLRRQGHVRQRAGLFDHRRHRNGR